MKNINELYHNAKEHRYYDYAIVGARQLSYRINNGKPFEVFHEDGSSTFAYGFGEKQFTYSLYELQEAKKIHQEERANLNERNKLLEQLKDVDLETLRMLVELTQK